EFIKKAPPKTPKADSEKTAIQHALWFYTGDATRVAYLLFGRPPETRRLSPLLKKYGLQAKASRGQVSRASRQPIADLKITAADLLNRSAQLKAEAQSSGILTVDQASRAVVFFSQAVRQALDPKDAAGLLPMESTLEDVFLQLRGQAPAVPVSDSHKPSVMALTRYLNALS
ncbi:MAG TPA: hypothetical protein VJC08_01210, partial [bacterium]|nr:hypothetical protein [bacterium]